MKISNFVLIPPRCTTEESLGHWRDFFILAGVCVVGVFVVPDPATNTLSGAVAAGNVCATWIAAVWATVASLRRAPSASAGGPYPTVRSRLTRAWVRHMSARISRVRDRFRARGAGPFPWDA